MRPRVLIFDDDPLIRHMLWAVSWDLLRTVLNS
jgi:hypothetical protein